MILLDFSGTIVAATMASLYLNPNEEHDEKHIRKSVLSSIKNYKVRFKEYGELIIACDSQVGYWRKDIFPYYKCKRKETRDNDNFDWPAIFKSIQKIKNEINDFLPYPVMEIPKAEADDVIAVLVRHATTQNDKVLIISRDKDLKQLQKYPQVKQWNPVDKRWEECNDPEQFLREHIICGDIGDSVPNIFSPENVFAIKQRQSPATKKRIESGVGLDGRYALNEKLIDLDNIPDTIQWNIIESYESQINKGKKKLMMYLLSHGLENLVASMQDF